MINLIDFSRLKKGKGPMIEKPIPINKAPKRDMRQDYVMYTQDVQWLKNQWDKLDL